MYTTLCPVTASSQADPCFLEPEQICTRSSEEVFSLCLNPTAWSPSSSTNIQGLKVQPGSLWRDTITGNAGLKIEQGTGSKENLSDSIQSQTKCSSYTKRNSFKEQSFLTQFFYLVFVLLFKCMFWQEILLPECCLHFITNASASCQVFFHLNVKFFINRKIPNDLFFFRGEPKLHTWFLS